MFKLVIFTSCFKIQETETEANRFGLRCSMRFPFLQGFHSCSRPTAARPRRGYLRSEGSFPPAIGTRPAGSPDRGIPAAPSRCTPSPAAGGGGFWARGGNVDNGIARQFPSLLPPPHALRPRRSRLVRATSLDLRGYGMHCIAVFSASRLPTRMTSFPACEIAV